MLPPRVLALIREYSKPVTPANWKIRREWICVGDLYKNITRLRIVEADRQYLLYKRFMDNVQNNHEWYHICLFAISNGIHETSNVFGIKFKVCYDIVVYH